MGRKGDTQVCPVTLGLDQTFFDQLAHDPSGLPLGPGLHAHNTSGLTPLHLALHEQGL